MGDKNIILYYPNSFHIHQFKPVSSLTIRFNFNFSPESETIVYPFSPWQTNGGKCAPPYLRLPWS